MLNNTPFLMTIRSKTLYIALHGTIFKVFPNNTVIHNSDKISSAYITIRRRRPSDNTFGSTRSAYKILAIEYNDGTKYRADLERLVLLRTMKVTDEKSDDI